MPSLSDKQIDEVHDFLVQRGISSEPLRIDLLDHICCLVEESINNGTPFDAALKIAVKQFGPSGIEATQEATIFFLTLKSRKMKKITSIIGIVGGIITMFATLFKIMHWPGAGILLTVGIVLISLVYLPFSLITNLQEKNDFRDKITVFGGFIGGSILSLSALFKIMYWPGFTKLFVAGVLFLLLVYMPLKFLKSYRSSENKLFNISGLLVILAGVALFFGLYQINGNTSRYLKMTEDIQKISMDNYHLLKAKIVYEVAMLKEHSPQKYDRALKIELVSNALAESMQRYRMDLLRSDLELKNAEGENTPFALDLVKNYAGFDDFQRSLNLLNQRTSMDRSTALVNTLNAYETLVMQIAEARNMPSKNLSASAHIFKGRCQALKMTIPNFKWSLFPALTFVNLV